MAATENDPVIPVDRAEIEALRAKLARVEARVSEWEQTGPVWFDAPTDAATEIRAALADPRPARFACDCDGDDGETGHDVLCPRLKRVRGRRVTEEDVDW